MAGSAAGPSLVARVRRTIEVRGLLARGDRVLVACSGGPDSVALLDVLDRLRAELELGVSVASVDHGLRPEAAAEVRGVAALASARGLPFHACALALSPGATAAVARAARYDALRACAEGAAIAVGHTQDDQAETVLARLLRGAGLDGLRGIEPHRADGVVRPLLDVGRADVLAHLTASGLAYVVDPSNHDRRSQRARIRHDLLPRLAAESPAIAVHLAALADEVAASRRAADEGIGAIVDTALRTGRLEMAALQALSRAARDRAIARILAGFGVRASRALRHAVVHALHAGGEVWLPGGRALVGSDGALLLVARTPVPAPVGADDAPDGASAAGVRNGGAGPRVQGE